MILGGDANAHFGPDERLNGFVGKFTTQTSSWHFVEWCVQEGLLHVDSYLSCRRRGACSTITWANGTNKTSLCPLWEAWASVGGDLVSGFPFFLWGGTNTSSTPAE